MKKITDKQRLDWLQKHMVGVNPEFQYGKEWRVGDSSSEFRRTIRSAIDYAIRTENE